MSATPEAAAAAPTPPNQANIDSLRKNQLTTAEANQRVDLFSAGGFALANRIGKALSMSSSVPAIYRQTVEKKGKGGVIEYIDNPAALSNCIVAIDIAQALGVSLMSVMQNGNIIEGRFTWSAQYKIAAINASKRFTPLRFEKINKGKINASYKEKQGWNKDKGGFDFKDVVVEGLDNWECVAWALPHGFALPVGVYTLAQAKEAGLPVIEGAPVSMLLAVEEGWYGKSGSKWQTEMKHLMLQYRAGSFFGNIHAPDLLIGFNMTSEEAEDITTLDVDSGGNVTKISTDNIVRPAAAPADVVVAVAQRNGEGAQPEDPIHDKAAPAAAAVAQDPAASAEKPAAAEPLTYAVVMDVIVKATTELEVEAARALIPRVVDAVQQAELNAKATARSAEIAKPAMPAASGRRSTPSQPLE
ncbi:hypothetical protein [Polaromonas sp.]|uniref:hypothetical protein n=1 Tax=Polaromonas sp. TaxID=1869339 RepID=UPI003267CB23